MSAIVQNAPRRMHIIFLHRFLPCPHESPLTNKKRKPLTMPTDNSHDMQACIDACSHCHQICLQTAMNHCLESGGKHLEPEHFRLMINCAEICQTSLNFMLSGSRLSNHVCGVCARICDACAESCEKLDGMEECARACRKCAESCRSMAS